MARTSYWDTRGYRNYFLRCPNPCVFFSRTACSASVLNCDAIIGMRYDATEFMQGATEVLAYGTAVVIEPVPR